MVELWPETRSWRGGWYRNLSLLVLLGGLLLSAGNGLAADRADCSDAAYRAFDFWLGQWVVHLADGTEAGRNRISAPASGCHLIEEWTSAGGGTGYSLNYFDPAAGRWRQLWVSQDALIDISGGLEGGSMVLTGEITNRLSGERAPFRGRWTVLPDGRVRQFFEQRSTATWEPWFEGFYSKVVE